MVEYDTIEEMLEFINDMVKNWQQNPEREIYTYFDLGHYKRTYPDVPHKVTEGEVTMEVEIKPKADAYTLSTNIIGEERKTEDYTFDLDLATWSKHKFNIYETDLAPENVVTEILKLIEDVRSFKSTEEMRDYILKANDVMVVRDEVGLAKEPLTKETATFEEWMGELAGQFYPLDIGDLPDFAFRDYYDAGENTYSTAYDMKEELKLPHGIYE